MMNHVQPVFLAAVLVVACGPGESAADDGSDARASEGTHEEEGHEELVVLSEDQMAAAGITIVEAGPALLRVQLELAAVVAPNLDAQAQVTPRVSGIVNGVHVGLGDDVRAGDLLCEIDSTEFGRLVSGYVTALATVQIDEETLEGEQTVLERNVELALEVFEREEELADQGIATLSARYAAESRLQEARLERDSRLLELKARVARGRIELVAAERELELLGVSHETLEAVAEAVGEPHAQLGRYSIRAPRDGVIVERSVTDAQYVDTETTLFTIQDLSTVWVMGAVYEQDLSKVRVDTPADVTLDAHPGASFPGRVEFIDTSISPTTRSAAVRIALENGPLESWPEKYPVRPGMYGVVELTIGEFEAAVVVPESALVHDESASDFVFVETGPGEFEQRSVRIGAQSLDRVEVLGGLEVGESVAATGTFILKSASRSDELGEGDED